MAGKPAQVWDKVGKALRSTPYQVLDQDVSMGSYYVLDAPSTGNKVTKATPIYRVYLKPIGDKTEILLFNQHNQPAIREVAKRIIAAIQQKIA